MKTPWENTVLFLVHHYYNPNPIFTWQVLNKCSLNELMNFSINLKVKFMSLKALHNPALPMFVVHPSGSYIQAIPDESPFLKYTMKFHNPVPLFRPLTHPQSCFLSLLLQPPQFHWMKFYSVFQGQLNCLLLHWTAVFFSFGFIAFCLCQRALTTALLS